MLPRWQTVGTASWLVFRGVEWKSLVAHHAVKAGAAAGWRADRKIDDARVHFYLNGLEGKAATGDK